MALTTLDPRTAFTQVVIAGVAQAREELSWGRAPSNVTLAIDAMTDMRPEAHDYDLLERRSA